MVTLSEFSLVLTRCLDSNTARGRQCSPRGRMSSAMLKPQSSPAAASDFEGTVVIRGVTATEESLSGK